jgi:hypothetical protein
MVFEHSANNLTKFPNQKKVSNTTTVIIKHNNSPKGNITMKEPTICRNELTIVHVEISVWEIIHFTMS